MSAKFEPSRGVRPRPPSAGGPYLDDDHEALVCMSCWGSGEGDVLCLWGVDHDAVPGTEHCPDDDCRHGACSRCHGWSVEPRVATDDDGTRRWAYGGSGDDVCEWGDTYAGGDVPTGWRTGVS